MSVVSETVQIIIVNRLHIHKQIPTRTFRFFFVLPAPVDMQHASTETDTKTTNTIWQFNSVFDSVTLSVELLLYYLYISIMGAL